MKDTKKKQQSNWRSFEEARDFVRSLGLKSGKEWQTWCKSGSKPDDIPVNPHQIYKDQGWVGLGDWLGTGAVANQNRTYRPFEKARAYVRSLGLKNQTEWKDWYKSHARPDDIPANPSRVYKAQGWISMGDWLGTGNIASTKRTFLPFEKARIFARSLGFKNQKEWQKWVKNNSQPDDIPADPSRTYKNQGWMGWGDWLGTGNIASHNRNFLPFDKARAYVHRLQFKNGKGYQIWAKSKDKPDYIPADPVSVYKNKGWLTWGDWLGTGTVAVFNRTYRPFENARSFARSLGLKNYAEWQTWAKSKDKPDDIPADPYYVYKDKGWISLDDWLGIVNRWSRNSIINFLRSIEPVLSKLKPTELYAIMRQNGLMSRSLKYANSNYQLIKSIQDLCSSPNPEFDFEKIVAEIEKQNSVVDNDELGEDEAINFDVLPVEETTPELPKLCSFSSLKAVDILADAGITSDEETIEFLVCNRVSELWQACLNNDPEFDLDRLRTETGGTYFNEIRNRFLSQYDGAINLPIPPGYSFHSLPKLMQKLTAYRVLTERRVGNWSGVGAGKTISAILTSRVIDARLTVIIAFNSTVKAWEEVIKSVYPDSIVIVKQRDEIEVNREKHTYLILNFETFQQPNAEKMARGLVDNHQIYFIVLDEIQNVKQRLPKIESKRRQVVNGLICEAGNKNPNLCVLGMSATPVINNLYEAKALLEMIKGVEFNDIKTFSSIANAIAIHEKLILYGIRYRPNYKQAIETTHPEISGEAFIDPLLEAFNKGSILDKERILLDVKINTIIGELRKGTLVYTHYLTGLIEPLRQAIENAGFTVGLFTGEDKTGLKDFCQCKVDVLIGTAPVGTGVDGMQYVCNRLIIVSLPWTNAEYEQLIGRLYRQGSAFEKVEVIIPQVVLSNKDDIWSWDKWRWHRVQWKKTLADAAIDGVIPQGELVSPETMQKKAKEALQAWIERVEKDGVYSFNRTRLKVPLPEFEKQIACRRFGDFSMMNNRFNNAYSKTTHERLKENPEEWYLYHTLYREARQNWAEIPYEKIANSLEKRPDWVVGDFGCGEAKLAESLPNKVYSFDHIAINQTVIACDMVRTPLKDNSLDVAVFSLSLMGINYPDYLKEAYRVLKFGGFLKIAEPLSRWLDRKSELLDKITNTGFSTIGDVEESSQFIYINAIKALS